MATEEELRADLDEWVRNQNPIFARIDSDITGAPRVSYCGRLGKQPGDGPESTYFQFSLIDQTNVRGFDINIQAATLSAGHPVFGKAVELEWKRRSDTAGDRAIRLILSEQSAV